MKLKKVSLRTMNPLHTYITRDCGTIYKVNKTYGDKNVIIAEYKLKKNTHLSDFAVYYLNTYIKVNEAAMNVYNLIDLGIKPLFVIKDDKLIFSDVDKAIEKLNRFIASINC